jgi:hypothetical protein
VALRGLLAQMAGAEAEAHLKTALFEMLEKIEMLALMGAGMPDKHP